jgi:predicted permease
VVAALSIRTSRALDQIDPGFDTENLLTFRLDAPSSMSIEDAQLRAFFQELSGNISALPGIESAGLVSHRPIVGGEPNRSFGIEGQTVTEPTERPWAATVTVDPGLFSTLRLSLIKGRSFSLQDSPSSAPVAILSRSAVARYWPDEEPIGQRIRLGDADSGAPWIEIIGVVGDVRNPDADQPPEPHIYLPFAQSVLSSMAVIARTSGDPLSILPSVRSAVWEVNPQQTIYDARTMDQILLRDLAGNFILTGLMGYFAFVALGLATAGVFGVVSYFVNERTQEIGIRIALGARFADVVTTVILRGLAPVILGVGLGMVGGFAVARLMMSMMYGVSPTDPPTFVGAPLLLMSVAFLASLIPALRAARIDPIVALRYE